jgi:hypothetical protein
MVDKTRPYSALGVSQLGVAAVPAVTYQHA